MRTLFDDAMAKANTAEQVEIIKTLSVHMEFLALSGQYKDMYANGDEASKKAYTERYEALYNYVKDTGFDVGVGSLPETTAITSDPIYMWYRDAGLGNND